MPPGPLTREKRRLEGSTLWQKSATPRGLMLDALDTPPDDAELEAEEAGFSFSPNPLWQRDAGFVQRRSPLTRKLETLKLSGPRCAATTTSTGIGLNAALGSQQHSRPVSRTAAEPIARCHE